MKQPILTDQEIVNGFRNNNKDIMVAAYKLIIPNVRAFVASRGGSKAMAEEVAWRALTKFWQRCQKPDFELQDQHTGFGAYITRTYRNLWADWHKEGEIKHKTETLTHNEPSEINVTDHEPPEEKTTPYRKGNAALEHFADETHSAEKLVLQQVNTLIWKLVDSLSVKCRDFFKLYYQEELSYEEIAEIKKVSAGAIRKQKNECKEPFMRTLINSPYFKELQENYPHLVKRIIK